MNRLDEPHRKAWEDLNRKIVACGRCPRLRRYCSEIAERKKREFREETYWGKPVPGFGDPKAHIWIMGLAPAAHGANRTGRMFTGDSSGRWLFRALYHAGFSNQPNGESRGDGLALNGIFISSSARCAPPDNKPLPVELERCRPFLDAEYELLTNVRLFLALGSIGFSATLSLVGRHGIEVPRPRPRFGHGAYYELGDRAILSSYHPSRQNTQTGKLTETMWLSLFDRARELVGA